MAQAQPVMLVDPTGNYVAAGGGSGGGGGAVTANINQIGGAPYALGPNTAANSQSVVFATDSLLSITGTVNATGTMTLGAGAATIGNVGLNAGTNIVGKFGIDQTTPGVTNGVALSANATGSAAMLVSSTIISSTATIVVKASPGTVYGVSIDNNSAGPVYAKLYNNTTATVGTGTPVIRLMCEGPTNGGGAHRDWGQPTIGVGFLTGICLIVTQNQADNDTVAVPTGTVTVNVWYR